MKLRLISLMMILFLAACKKDKSNTPLPPISITPSISLLNVKPTAIHQLSDSLVFTIQYTDGDGDLGFADADSMSLFVTDKRFPLTTAYHVPPLSPSGTSITLTGQLPIVLKHIILKDQNSPKETATFDIQLKDRAGHYSNVVTTGTVTILP